MIRWSARAADEVRDALALRVILTPADDAPEQLVAVRKASGVVELEEFLGGAFLTRGRRRRRR